MEEQEGEEGLLWHSHKVIHIAVLKRKEKGFILLPGPREKPCGRWKTRNIASRCQWILGGGRGGRNPIVTFGEIRLCAVRPGRKVFPPLCLATAAGKLQRTSWLHALQNLCAVQHCIALHCTALHCTALHCTAMHCVALLYSALYCTVLQWQAHPTGLLAGPPAGRPVYQLVPSQQPPRTSYKTSNKTSYMNGYKTSNKTNLITIFVEQCHHCPNASILKILEVKVQA